MSRLPISVKIVEDELFTSWMETVARLNGCETTDEKKQFYDLFFGCNLTKSGCLINLQDICRNTFVPDVLTILKKHMSIYAFLPLVHIGVQGKKIEYCLRNPKRPAANVVGWAGNSSTNRICPICAKNDIKKYGRKIIHVPHQLKVKTCWKHNVRLVDAEYVDYKLEYGTLQQKQMAVFMYDLYKNPIYTTYEQTIEILQKVLKNRQFTTNKIGKELVRCGYLTEDEINNKMSVTVTCKNTDYIFAALVWAFGTADNFRKAIPAGNLFHSVLTDDFELLEEIDIISKYRCKKCGHIFYMHVTAVDRGTPCPECNKNMSSNEVYERYLKRYYNNEYEFVSNNKIRHKPCGTIYNAVISARFWKDTAKCEICNSKLSRWQKNFDPTMTEYKVKMKSKNSVEVIHIPYQHSFTLHMCSFARISAQDAYYCRVCNSKVNINKREREGEENIDKAGQKRVLIAYHSSNNIQVQYEDRKIYKMTYQSFLNSHIPLSRIRVNHIGEKMVNRQGDEVEIIRYRTLYDLDVKFLDGTIIEHETYYKFTIGTIMK